MPKNKPNINLYTDLENIHFKVATDGELIYSYLQEKFNLYGIDGEVWFLPRHYSRDKPPYTQGSAVYDEPRLAPDAVSSDVQNKWDFDGPHAMRLILIAIEEADESDDRGAQESDDREVWTLRRDITAAGGEELLEGDIVSYNGAYYDVIESKRSGWMNPGTFFLFESRVTRRTRYIPERRIPEDQRQ